MSNVWYVLLFSLVGGIFSLIGGLLLLSRKKSAYLLATYATPFAAGALLAAGFFDLIPESLEKLGHDTAMAWVLGGIIIFFLLEHFLNWFHHHHEHGKDTTPAPLVIAGDSLHNLLDGIAIGAAFLIDIPTGIVTALAVAAHEIPQEIGDFGLLLKFGYERKKVILINVFSALLSTVGALITYRLGNELELPVATLLAITAGMFIYIAASDLIPTIHQESTLKSGNIAAVLLVTGVLVVGLLTSVTHAYIDVRHNLDRDKGATENYHLEAGNTKNENISGERHHEPGHGHAGNHTNDEQGLEEDPMQHRQ